MGLNKRCVIRDNFVHQNNSFPDFVLNKIKSTWFSKVNEFVSAECYI